MTPHKSLLTIPGIGKKIAQDLIALGYRHPKDLKGQDPEQMYQKLMALKGQHVDRCMLYVFRCAVYYASNDVHEPEKLKWWKWKDKK
jgi:hypothetical protein